jgi:hypothetical protein
MKISINYIPHDRYLYVNSFLKEITKISSSLKKDIVVNFLISSTKRDWKADKDFLASKDVHSNVFLIKNGDYMTKIKTALENSDQYAIKLDEDIFVPANVWEYMLSNLNVLEDKNNLFISPILSTGIPTVDKFANQFLTQEERETLYDIFLKTALPSIWGANYEPLIEHTFHAKEWNSDNFYNEVGKIQHYYKGVHPVRFSSAAQTFLLNCVLKNLDKILNETNFSLYTDQKPYFCNSVFGIKKDVWTKILNDTSLFKDGFDEVPLNLYREDNKLNMVFINNGFSVHPSYNTINVFGDNYKVLSDRFFNHEYFKQQ